MRLQGAVLLQEAVRSGKPFRSEKPFRSGKPFRYRKPSGAYALDPRIAVGSAPRVRDSAVA